MRIPIMEEEKEGLPLRALVQQMEAALGNLLAIAPWLGAIVVPTGILVIAVERRLDPAPDVVHGGGEVAVPLQQVRQKTDGRVQLLLAALGHDLVSEDVLAGEEGGVRRLSRDVGADALVEA